MKMNNYFHFRFCNLPKSTLNILEKIFDFVFSDVHFTLPQLSAFRCYEAKSTFNAVFEEYYEKSILFFSEISGQFSNEKSFLSLQQLINESCSSEIKKYKKMKNDFSIIKSQYLQKMIDIKVDCKFLPTLIEILQKEKGIGIGAEILTMRNNDEIFRFCKCKNISLKALYEDSSLKEKLLNSKFV
jgi:hypothetical protein